jgi:hypothetical protein
MIEDTWTADKGAIPRIYHPGCSCKSLDGKRFFTMVFSKCPRGRIKSEHSKFDLWRSVCRCNPSSRAERNSGGRQWAQREFGFLPRRSWRTNSRSRSVGFMSKGVKKDPNAPSGAAQTDRVKKSRALNFSETFLATRWTREIQDDPRRD